MPALRDLQRSFWRAIASAPGTLSAGTELLAVTEPSRTLRADERLAVYADAYYLRLHEVLSEDFPRTAAALGDEGFAALARDYLRCHPSTHPSVRHLGDALPAFLAADARWPGWLADLARLERARTDVFDAPDEAPIALEALRIFEAAAWPMLRFTPIRAFELLDLAWPAHDVWRNPRTAPAASAPTPLRVWRGTDDRVFHAPVEPRAALALRRLVRGEPFATICAVFDDLPAHDAARETTALLARWLADGMIGGVRTAAA